MRHFKLATICAVFVLAVSMSAFAGSVNNFSNVQLTGGSGNTFASGSFTFTGNASGGTFSNLSLSFNGAFNDVATNGGGQAFCAKGWCGFAWKTKVDGDFVWNIIAFNPSNGQIQEWGGIADSQNYGNFKFLSVPEGGARLSYLMLSAMAVFGGIFLSGKQRRSTL
jgi:hypothetical protein